jgi:hypothetical protein
VEKSSPKICNFTKTDLRKQLPNRQNLAQSGHPVKNLAVQNEVTTHLLRLCGEGINVKVLQKVGVSRTVQIFAVGF